MQLKRINIQYKIFMLFNRINIAIRYPVLRRRQELLLPWPIKELCGFVN